MFKRKLYKLPLFLLIILIGLCSCENRKSKKELLNESVSNFKDTIDPIKINKYLPEGHFKTETDTILSNGFRYKIVSAVDMDHAVLKQISKNTIVENQYYRQSKVKLQVYNDNKLIFDKVIDTTFIQSNTGFKSHLGQEELIISDLYLDPKSYLNIKGDKLYFRIRGFNPNNKLDTRINLLIDETGNYSLHSTKSYPI